MPNRASRTGSELFIVDNSAVDWKVLRYLHDWCQISSAIDIATGYFEIGALLGLTDEWQKVDRIRIVMGDEVSRRTKGAFALGLANIRNRLDTSLEVEKQKNDFLDGVPAIVDAIRSGKIACRVYRQEKFHAKAYITHARLEVVGSSALVGSSYMRFFGQYLESLPVPYTSAADYDVIAGLAKQAHEVHRERRQRVERFLWDVGIDPSQSSSRNPLERPWTLTNNQFLRRATNGEIDTLTEARDETAAFTEEIGKIEREIDERVASLYGL